MRLIHLWTGTTKLCHLDIFLISAQHRKSVNSMSLTRLMRPKSNDEQTKPVFFSPSLLTYQQQGASLLILASWPEMLWKTHTSLGTYKGHVTSARGGKALTKQQEWEDRSGPPSAEVAPRPIGWDSDYTHHEVRPHPTPPNRWRIPPVCYSSRTAVPKCKDCKKSLLWIF